jgi:integrase
MKLTKRVIDHFVYEKEGNKTDIRWDDEVRMFGVRIYPSGKKSFVLRYARANSRKTTTVIGQYGDFTLQQARDKARSMKVDIADGQDPIAIKQAQRTAVTMNELAIRYMDEHANVKKKPKSAQEDKRNLSLHVLPVLGSQAARELTRENISSLHNGLRDKPYLANRVLSLLSKMFNLAEMWGYREDGSNPCRHIQKFSEESRERFLSEEELTHLFSVLVNAEKTQAASKNAIAAIRLLIHTGCRLDEIRTLKWEYVDLGNGQLNLPDSKTGAKVVHLSEAAVQVLSRLIRVKNNPHVIVGKKEGASLVNLDKPWRKLKGLAGLDDVRIHDLRHTFASIAASKGYGLHVIGGLLGHKSTATTSRYAHLQTKTLKDAVETISSGIAVKRAGAKIIYEDDGATVRRKPELSRRARIERIRERIQLKRLARKK